MNSQQPPHQQPHQHQPVSVVIPVYPPHFDQLPTCVGRLLRSTELPCEIIIAASEADSTTEAAILDSIAQQCGADADRVPILFASSPDVGYSGVNRNRGAARARADIIVFLDADDFIHPQKIEMVRQCFDRFPDCKQLLHTCTPTMQLHTLDEVLGRRFSLDVSKPFRYQGDFSKQSIVKNGMRHIHRGHATVHRSVLDAVRYKVVRHRQDNIFTKNVHRHFNQSYFLPMPLIVYNESGIAARDAYYDDKA